MKGVSYVPYIFRGAWQDTLCDGFKTSAEAEAFIAEYLRKHPDDRGCVAVHIWDREAEMCTGGYSI